MESLQKGETEINAGVLFPHDIVHQYTFDACAACGEAGSQYYIERKPEKKLFSTIKERYAEYGYQLPRLIFWNIQNRTGTIPVRENELGAALVSGFSPATVRMMLSESTDPLACLLEQLDTDRYKAVEEAVGRLVA